MEEYIQDILQNILTATTMEFGHISIELQSTLEGEQEEYYCNVESKEAALLIGKNAQNMLAIQHLVKLILLKRTNKSVNITLDIDSYRIRQKEKLIGLTEKLIDKLKETQKSQKLPPMSPYFRRLIHLHIKEKHPDVNTRSEGKGDYRHIIINPA